MKIEPYTKTIKMSAQAWCDITGVEVIDPDGWDRKDPKFSENWNNHPISLDEFRERCFPSTCRGHMTDKQVKAWKKLEEALRSDY